MLKVGLLGVGGISGAHIPAWNHMEGVELAAMCDIVAENMDRYPDQHHYTDFDEMMEQENLDILDICLPTFLHAEYAIRAMDKGLHVICEKPISLHREDVKRVYDAAARNHVTFMIAQVLRFWPEYEYLKSVYDNGTYGKLLSGSMQRLGTCPGWSWEGWMRDEARSGLVPYDLHVHDCDFMVYAFGKPLSTCSKRSKRPEQDVIHAVYEYDGFYVSADAAWYGASYPFGAGYRFQFEKAVLDFQHGTLTVYETDNKSFHPMLQEQTGETGSIDLPKSDAYENEIRYFAECVKNGVPADRVKPEELETVIDILNSL